MRYLTGRLTDTTIILLTGRSIRFIDAAAALARRLQPSMVVLEDVDLVATDRDYTPDGNPLLFSLSGSLNPVEGMPKWMQPLTVLNPIHHLATIVRGCLIKGSGFGDLWTNFFGLAALTLGLLTLSIWRFRGQLS